MSEDFSNRFHGESCLGNQWRKCSAGNCSFPALSHTAVHKLSTAFLLLFRSNLLDGESKLLRMAAPLSTVVGAARQSLRRWLVRLRRPAVDRRGIPVWQRPIRTSIDYVVIGPPCKEFSVVKSKVS